MAFDDDLRQIRSWNRLQSSRCGHLAHGEVVLLLFLPQDLLVHRIVGASFLLRCFQESHLVSEAPNSLMWGFYLLCHPFWDFLWIWTLQAVLRSLGLVFDGYTKSTPIDYSRNCMSTSHLILEWFHRYHRTKSSNHWKSQPYVHCDHAVSFPLPLPYSMSLIPDRASKSRKFGLYHWYHLAHTLRFGRQLLYGPFLGMVGFPRLRFLSTSLHLC